VGRTPTETLSSHTSEDPAVPLIDVAGQPVHVLERGAGEPIVFLHAFPLHAAMWDYQLEVLSPTHRCLALDMPGFGASPPPEDPESATIEGWADLVAGVLDSQGIDTATVVGASMGGYVAMAMLRRHPGRIAGLVLISSRARSDDGPTAERRAAQLRELRAGADLDALAKGLVEGLLSSSSLARDDLADYVRALTTGVTREGWIAALEAMRKRPDAMFTLRQAGVPGLVIVGEMDRVTPIAEANLIRSMLGDAEIVVVPGVGHLPNLEAPDAVDSAILAFLGVGGSGGS
jgi:pimeloyl-ACP methyl ester carboxylesterase